MLYRSFAYLGSRISGLAWLSVAGSSIGDSQNYLKSGHNLILPPIGASRFQSFPTFVLIPKQEIAAYLDVLRYYRDFSSRTSAYLGISIVRNAKKNSRDGI